MAGGLSGGRAALPMYDWAETHAAHDDLWTAVREALRARGVAAPDALERGAPLMEVWTAPDLVLGQTCGLPYVRHLRDRVALVGAPDLGLPGCPPGWYRSVIVVQADDPREGLGAFRGARLAVNGADSQSGAQAMMHHASALPDPGTLFGSVTVSGAHEASARLVAEGEADVAAIDAGTWRLVEAHRPFAARLRVMEATDPTPGLPFVTALDPGPVAAALEEAIAARPETCVALGLRGLVRLSPAEYDLIAGRDAAARGLSAVHGL